MTNLDFIKNLDKDKMAAFLAIISGISSNIEFDSSVDHYNHWLGQETDLNEGTKELQNIFDMAMKNNAEKLNK